MAGFSTLFSLRVLRALCVCARAMARAMARGVCARTRRRARIAIVSQHHADSIDLSMSPLQFMQARFPGDGGEGHRRTLRSFLANCGPCVCVCVCVVHVRSFVLGALSLSLSFEFCSLIHQRDLFSSFAFRLC